MDRGVALPEPFIDVLLVEDMAREARAVASLLKLRGAGSVTVASDGGTALRELNARKFDLIISDITLPDVSGIEVLKAAQRRRPQAFRAALTAKSEAECTAYAMVHAATAPEKPVPRQVARRRKTTEGRDDARSLDRCARRFSKSTRRARTS
jgi:CheY-like chemotaxis protein